MSGPLAGLRVAYFPNRPDLSAPGDRRRFVWYAQRRELPYSLTPDAGEHDVVYLTALADIARWATYRGPAKLVFELIDSYLAPSRLSPRAMFRGAAKWATGSTSRLLLDYHAGIEAMCRRADAVVCSTEEQRLRILDLCPNVHVILDHHGEVDGAVKSDHTGGDVLRLVWEGLPQNLVGFDEIAPALRALHEARPVHVDLVTDERSARWMNRYGWRRTAELAERIPVPWTIHPWSVQTLVERAVAADLAVIPLRRRDPFAMGKPENKLLIFWRLGVPTLTSATPAYVRAMAAAGVPMACTDTRAWRASLEHYGGDAAARAEAAAKGRQYVQAVHGEEQLLRRWDELFASVLP